MSYQFERDEPLARGVRRVARETIDGALDATRWADRDAAVHDLRKRFKKLRALLRLLRDELPTPLRKERNRTLRDAARTISDLRDSRVLVDTTIALREGADDPIATDLDALEAALEVRHAARTAEQIDGEHRLTRLRPLLTELREDVDTWPLSDRGFAALAPGLLRAYRRGVDRLADAREEHGTEALHDLRKRVKDLWYHTRLLAGAWGPVLSPLAEEMHHLSDHLGLDHDLAVLEETLEAEPGRLPDDAARARIAQRIASRRAHHQREALRLAHRIYAEPPAAFVDRLRAYWTAWRR